MTLLRACVADVGEESLKVAFVLEVDAFVRMARDVRTIESSEGVRVMYIADPLESGICLDLC